MKPDALEQRAVEIENLVRRYVAGKLEEPPVWILPPASCRFLADLCALYPGECTAFEFGSGRSTHALRSVTASTTSVESSEEWLAQTESNSADKRSADTALIVPLRRFWNRARLIESFDLSRNEVALNALQRAQVILVDSPPNPAKREHALFCALRYASPGAIVMLDDLEVRATNRFAHRLAAQNKQMFRFWRVAIDHQLGLFLKLRGGRMHSRPTLREFVGTWLRV